MVIQGNHSWEPLTKMQKKNLIFIIRICYFFKSFFIIKLTNKWIGIGKRHGREWTYTSQEDLTQFAIKISKFNYEKRFKKITDSYNEHLS